MKRDKLITVLNYIYQNWHICTPDNRRKIKDACQGIAIRRATLLLCIADHCANHSHADSAVIEEKYGITLPNHGIVNMAKDNLITVDRVASPIVAQGPINLYRMTERGNMIAEKIQIELPDTLRTIATEIIEAEKMKKVLPEHTIKP